MKHFLATFLCLTLFSCGGGGSSSSSLPGVVTAQNRAAVVTIIIPAAPSSQATSRHPLFVSPGVNGALVQIFAQSDTAQASPLESATFDLSATSALCTTASPRVCTVSLNFPIGADTISAILYTSAPVNGVIPSTAKTLGVASLNQIVTAGSAPLALTVLVAPIVTGVTVTNPLTSFVSLSSGQGPQSVAIAISALDAAGFAVTGTYAKPLVMTVIEAGGSNHAALSLNGGPGAATVTLTASTDKPVITYDGNGSSGYSASVIFTLQGSKAPLATQTFSPIFVASTSPLFYPLTNSVTLNGPGSTATIAASEANSPNAPMFSEVASASCTGAATVTVGSPSFTLNGGTAPVASGCTVTVADATGATVLLNVTNTIGALPTPTPTPGPVPTPTPTSGPVPTPTPTSGPVPTPTPNPLTVTPTSLAFIATGAANAQNFTASETAYSGAFTMSTTCTAAIATVTPSSGTGPSSMFTVTPQGAGSCTVTIHDTNGQNATVTIGVTLAQGGIN